MEEFEFWKSWRKGTKYERGSSVGAKDKFGNGASGFSTLQMRFFGSKLASTGNKVPSVPSNEKCCSTTFGMKKFGATYKQLLFYSIQLTTNW